MARSNYANEGGFTLLEVLVALAVIAIALLAALRAIGQQTHGAALLTEQTLAQYVASNALTELKLAQPWPEPGRRSGRARLGRRDWYWTIEVSDTDVDRMRRIEAKVFTDPARQHQITDLAGFAGR